MTDIKLREDVSLADQWRIDQIFESDEVYEAAYEAFVAELAEFQPVTEITVATVKQHIEESLRLSRKLSTLSIYAHCRNDQDVTNTQYSGYFSQIQGQFARFGAATAYFSPMLLKTDRKTLEEIIHHPDMVHYKQYLDNLVRYQPHTLSEGEERLIASLSEVFSGAGNTYGDLCNADLTFEDVMVNGELKPLTKGNYIAYLLDEDQAVRRDAFMKMHQSYQKVGHTLTQTLTTQIKGEVVLANARKHGSALEDSLFDDRVPLAVYNSLIKGVEHALPVLHNYLGFHKEMKGLDDIHLYDLYCPVVSFTKRYSYDEAVALVLKAVEPMGEQYVTDLKNGLDAGWVDRYENRGKRSGAYCTGTCDTGPYVLMNFNGTLESVFTLAHELGHAMHSFYSGQKQDPLYARYRIFVAEVASITNEMLLRDYLIKNSDDPQEALYLRSKQLEAFRGTFFRQTMFAEYEKITHETVESGKPLTTDGLNDSYYALNQKYFGKDVVIDPEIASEWSRIPHFYYNFYVYKYAVGFAAAAALSQRILNKEPGARDRYLNSFLSAGSSKYPIDILKETGVDFTTEQPFIEALELFQTGVKEIREAAKELQNN